MNEGANRRQSVDEIVKNLTTEKVDVNQVTATLMKSFRNLDENSHQEREAFKDILASNVLLAKVVGGLVTEVSLLKRELSVLKQRR